MAGLGEVKTLSGPNSDPFIVQPIGSRYIDYAVEWFVVLKSATVL
jgi:hypothetical protein